MKYELAHLLQPQVFCQYLIVIWIWGEDRNNQCFMVERINLF